MTPGGLLLEYVELLTPDGLGWLELLTGTTALNAADKALGYVEAADVQDPPSPQPGLQIIGSVYDFGPDGANFNPALALVIEYDPDLYTTGRQHAVAANIFSSVFFERACKWRVGRRVEVNLYEATASRIYMQTYF